MYVVIYIYIYRSCVHCAVKRNNIINRRQRYRKSTWSPTPATHHKHTEIVFSVYVMIMDVFVISTTCVECI